MNDYQIRNIIFDLDGTLIDSSRDIMDCLKQAYSMANVKEGLTISKKIMGPPIREMIKKITPDLSDKDINGIVQNFRSLYDNSDLHKTTAYEGVHDLLKSLKDNKRELFLITNKPSLPTKKILDTLKLNYFRDIVTYDLTGADKGMMIRALIEKWNLERPQTVMVGDSTADIIAAKDNNILSVGILYGYSGEKDIMKAGPNFIAEDMESLRRILLSN